MVRKNFWLVVLVVAFLPCSAIADNSPQEKAAVSAAEKWLALIDAGNYGDSWQEAAELFRNAVTAAQWKQSLQGARKPLGKLISRKVKTATYRTSLPGAPDGKYVVIQFDTSFEKKNSARETVTPMMEQNGKWRVSGYYIK